MLRFLGLGNQHRHGPIQFASKDLNLRPHRAAQLLSTRWHRRSIDDSNSKCSFPKPRAFRRARRWSLANPGQ